MLVAVRFAPWASQRYTYRYEGPPEGIAEGSKVLVPAMGGVLEAEVTMLNPAHPQDRFGREIALKAVMSVIEGGSGANG